MNGKAKTAQSKGSPEALFRRNRVEWSLEARPFGVQAREADLPLREEAGPGPFDAYLESKSGIGPTQRRGRADKDAGPGRVPNTAAPLQRREEDAGDNQTGMPDRLKTGLEGLSGMDLGDVRVHYNSAEPARLQALAYTQGKDIYVGPGQERHLPHEGWHVVQQLQGRVRPTMQVEGAPVNDDAVLEREADVIGAKALQMRRDDRRFEHVGEGQPTQGTNGVVRQRTAVFRGMTEDNGKPAKGETARKLGVRTGAKKGDGDIVVTNGDVPKEDGGMSTSPDDPTKLPKHRRPPEWGGTGKDPVWETTHGALTNSSIKWVKDNSTHGTVVAADSMKYSAYKAALENTQGSWTKKTKS